MIVAGESRPTGKADATIGPMTSKVEAARKSVPRFAHRRRALAAARDSCYSLDRRTTQVAAR
jgi:hypothetical protein